MLQSVTECYGVFLAHLLGPIFGLVAFGCQLSLVAVYSWDGGGVGLTRLLEDLPDGR